MFPHINDALNNISLASLDGCFLLITDTLKADGSFLLHHFLHWFIKEKKFVVLTGLEQSYFHYFNVGRKLGTNLNNEKEHFIFVNCLSSPYSWTHSIQSTTPSIPSIEFSFPSQYPKGIFESLYLTIKKQMDSKPGGCIILDNLNLLLNLTSLVEVMQFLQYCQLLVKSKKKDPSLLVALIHKSEDDFVINTFSHAADVIFSVDELESGYSKETHGKLSIQYNSILSKEQSLLPVQLHFKTMEKTVHLFAPGTKA